MFVPTSAINPFDFPGGAALAAKAQRVATAIAAMRVRARRHRVPGHFRNDNLAEWRSDRTALIAQSTRPDSPGAPVVRRLQPDGSDYFVMKSTLPGFFQTPLDTMLRTGGVRTLIINGLTTDNCVVGLSRT